MNNRRPETTHTLHNYYCQLTIAGSSSILNAFVIANRSFAVTVAPLPKEMSRPRPVEEQEALTPNL